MRTRRGLPSVLDVAEVLVRGPDPAAFRIGLAIPRSGLLGISAPSVVDALLVAAAEINAARGRDGRLVEFVVLDSGGQPEVAASAISMLAASQTVEAFVALHTSATLEHVEQAVSTPLPYIFVGGYEGLPRQPGYFCAGESPRTSLPGLRWLTEDSAITRWAMIGADYVWPRTMRNELTREINALGGQLVVDDLVPLGHTRARMPTFIEKLRTSGAEGVVLNLVGRELADAILAIRAHGLDHLVRFATALEENVLYSVGGDSTGNLYSMLHSFHSMRSPKREAMEDKQRALVGDERPVLTNWAEHAYDGLHLLAALENVEQLTISELGTPDGTAETSAPYPTYDTHLAVASGLAFVVIPLPGVGALSATSS